MNLTPINVVVLGTGLILIYCAIKDVSPKDVLVNALHGKTTVAPAKPSTGSTSPNIGPTSGTPKPAVVSV